MQAIEYNLENGRRVRLPAKLINSRNKNSKYQTTIYVPALDDHNRKSLDGGNPEDNWADVLAVGCDRISDYNHNWKALKQWASELYKSEKQVIYLTHYDNTDIQSLLTRPEYCNRPKNRKS